MLIVYIMQRNEQQFFLVGFYKFVQRPFDRDMNELENKFKSEGFYDNRLVCWFIFITKLQNL